MEERAKRAVAARRAARLYTRERGLLPVTLMCQLLDGYRTFVSDGCWQPDGPNEEQIFAKYAQQYGVSPDEAHDDVYLTILRKSCTSNSGVDALVNLQDHAPRLAQAVGEAATLS